MKKIICKDTLKEFSKQYLSITKKDSDEYIMLGGILTLFFVSLLPILGMFLDYKEIDIYKTSIITLVGISFMSIMALPKSILVKLMPKTAYLDLIFKNSYNGDISDILDVEQEEIRDIISKNKERIKLDINTNGSISGRTLAYLMKEINKENVRKKDEKKFFEKNSELIKISKQSNNKINKIENY